MLFSLSGGSSPIRGPRSAAWLGWMALGLFGSTWTTWVWLGVLLGCMLTRLIVSAWGVPPILVLTLVDAKRHVWIGWIPPTLSDPLFPQSDVFVDAITGPSPCRETRRQKGLDLAYWPRRFWNDPHIAGRNNSNLSVSSYHTGWETKLLGVICEVWSSLGAGHIFGPWQMILGPTWWLSAGSRLYISPAGLEQRREREWEREPKPEREYEPKRRRV